MTKYTDRSDKLLLSVEVIESICHPRVGKGVKQGRQKIGGRHNAKFEGNGKSEMEAKRI